MDVTKSSDYAQKLKSIRKSEGLTQAAFAEITGVPLGTVKHYERGQVSAGLKVIEPVIANPRFQKYTLWLMTDQTSEAAGQISPTLSPDGQGSISKPPKDRKVG